MALNMATDALRDPQHDDLVAGGWIHVPELPGYLHEALDAAFFIRDAGKREYWKMHGFDGTPQWTATPPELWVSEGL